MFISHSNSSIINKTNNALNTPDVTAVSNNYNTHNHSNHNNNNNNNNTTNNNNNNNNSNTNHKNNNSSAQNNTTHNNSSSSDLISNNNVSINTVATSISSSLPPSNYADHISTSTVLNTNNNNTTANIQNNNSISANTITHHNNNNNNNSSSHNHNNNSSSNSSAIASQYMNAKDSASATPVYKKMASTPSATATATATATTTTTSPLASTPPVPASASAAPNTQQQQHFSQQHVVVNNECPEQQSNYEQPSDVKFRSLSEPFNFQYSSNINPDATHDTSISPEQSQRQQYLPHHQHQQYVPAISHEEAAFVQGPNVKSNQSTQTNNTSVHSANTGIPINVNSSPGKSEYLRRKTYPQENVHINKFKSDRSLLRHGVLKRENTLNDSANQEIQRMKFIILKKRETKKNKKNFMDDDRVLIGNKVSEGHSNYIMAYNMLTGIRVAVSRCSGIMKPLKEQDFKATKKLTFDITGNELTPSSKYDFKFKDYSPNVFRELRELFGLDPADYLVSLTAKYILSELNSPGKSGSFFYYSRDYKFIIKTIHHAEHVTLRRILKNYHQHVKSNPNTLVSQFYGLHRLKMPLKFTNKKRKIYFIVMNNLFPPNREIHRTYDLKGSLWKRETIVPPEENDEVVAENVNKKSCKKLRKLSPILKDQNWLNNSEKLNLGEVKKERLIRQLEKDVEFLQKSNIMDYSLLLGIHDANIGNVNSQNFSVFAPKDVTRNEITLTNPISVDNLSNLSVNKPRDDASNLNDSALFDQKFYFYSYENGFRSSDENNQPSNEIYYLGIIDCLTNYSCIKRMETFVKSFYQNRKEISAVPATEYGNRFLNFLKQRALLKDDNAIVNDADGDAEKQGGLSHPMPPAPPAVRQPYHDFESYRDEVDEDIQNEELVNLNKEGEERIAHQRNPVTGASVNLKPLLAKKSSSNHQELLFASEATTSSNSNSNSKTNSNIVTSNNTTTNTESLPSDNNSINSINEKVDYANTASANTVATVINAHGALVDSNRFTVA